MFAKIIALLAIVASAYGACYTGYGAYCNTGGVVGGVTRVLSGGCEVPAPCGSAPVISPPVVTAPYASPKVYTVGGCSIPYAPEVCNPCRTYVTPLYKETVGCPEFYSSCENSVSGVCSGF